ncbi:MAG TPA: ABC transporter ATP-binding protein, partial [Ilumatobacteraceae bacterium]|nr:ABC transporter ATP-binding protein [Ilumatobacteraceae bacterium]
FGPGDINFTVAKGETFGIVGHNGSGKSTMLKCLTSILKPDEGSVHVNGTVSALLELGAGFHPELSGRENVYLNAAILGVSRKHIHQRFDDIVSFSGLEQFIDTPVKNYSSGMFVRLGFAVAVNVDPDVMVIDEVLAVGDSEFQAKCNDKIAEFRERGKTIVLVTHSMNDVVRICQRAAWLDHGRLKMVGDPYDIVEGYSETARSTSTTQDGSRWGSQEAVVESVELLDGNGNPAPKAITGEAHIIRLHLHADRPVGNPDVTIELNDLNGVLVTSVNSTAREFQIPQIDDHTVVDFRIDALPLLEGTYELSVLLHDSSRLRELDIRKKCFRFDVTHGSARDHGLMTMTGSWSGGSA